MMMTMSILTSTSVLLCLFLFIYIHHFPSPSSSFIIPLSIILSGTAMEVLKYQPWCCDVEYLRDYYINLFIQKIVEFRYQLYEMYSTRNTVDTSEGATLGSDRDCALFGRGVQLQNITLDDFPTMNGIPTLSPKTPECMTANGITVHKGAAIEAPSDVSIVQRPLEKGVIRYLCRRTASLLLIYQGG